MQKTFSKSGALNFGWNKFKAHVGYFVGLVLIMFLFSVAFAFVTKELEGALSFVLTAVLYILQLVIGMGLTAIALKVCDDEYPSYEYLLSQKDKLFRYIGAAILYTIIVAFGFLLLIIPGIVWMIKYGLYYFLIIDKNMKPLDALSKSRDITDGVKWNLLLFYIVLGLVNFLGALLFYVGLFVTIPVTTIAMAHVYKELYRQTEIGEEGEQDTEATRVTEEHT